jgi:hypothetical protein
MSDSDWADAARRHIAAGDRWAEWIDRRIAAAVAGERKAFAAAIAESMGKAIAAERARHAAELRAATDDLRRRMAEHVSELRREMIAALTRAPAPATDVGDAIGAPAGRA